MGWLHAWIILALPQQLPLVVIDPGHGGAQEGARGVCGVLEKDVTLAVGTEVAALVNASYKALAMLTRTDDQDVELAARADKANHLGAQIFLSIHANSSTRQDVRGVETFFLSRESAEQRLPTRYQRLLKRENEGATDASTAAPSTLALILQDLALSSAEKASQRFAMHVQRGLQERVSTKARGVLQAPFIVLRGASMAAALVEVGFLSNPEECQWLGQAAYQQKIARALAAAILGHLELEHALLAKR